VSRLGSARRLRLDKLCKGYSQLLVKLYQVDFCPEALSLGKNTLS
jgi:hypothetical protein